ncbi:glycosyltransferase family 2 protein [Luteimonas vadosa]|uniref:Glycosyltransferase family 2 protein n=1 Tax=Luteimonas vadosa TaxID=1165507 RepID=A0ABP9DMS4_9GAMM
MSVTTVGADIAAIVVSHQSAATIDGCLARLRACVGVGSIRVVDNASSDETLAIVQRHALADPRLRFVANPDNPGFSQACNQGAADVEEAWLAFVNPDCLLEADALSRLREHALALDGEALLGADLVDEQGRRDGAARRHDPVFSRMLFSSRDRDLAVAMDPALPVQRVEAVSGALMLLPRRLFHRIDGFDAGYRLHGEDLDLCRRAREAGAVVAVANDVRVVHLRGVSSRSRPLFVEWHKHRGLWRYFRKFEAPHRGMVVRAAVWVAIAVRCKLSLLRTLLAGWRLRT